MYEVAKHLLVSCTPLSVRGFVGASYGTIQRSKKRFALCVDVVLDVDIARVNL